MNKILTTALALAAGTTLANAYTLVGTATSGTSWTTTETSYTTWSLVAVISDLSGLYSHLATGQTPERKTLVSYSETDSTSTASQVISTDYNSSNNITTATAIDVRYDNSSYVVTYTNGADYLERYSAIASASYATVTLTRNNGLGSGSTLYLTLMDSSGNVTTTYSANSDGLRFSSFYLTTVSVGEYVSSVYIYSDVLTATEVSSISAAVAVPEPSSFGLLAGLGALALVVSRRRRRSRHAA